MIFPRVNLARLPTIGFCIQREKARPLTEAWHTGWTVRTTLRSMELMPLKELLPYCCAARMQVGWQCASVGARFRLGFQLAV